MTVRIMMRILTFEETVTTHEKIDDDDGHYIVTEDMPIGERCECFSESGLLSSGVVTDGL